ncbi:hypothetical protein [Nannocystis sp. SCPEA4]|uniref:hypothetical protein n=1 Tax=Nannocystis sp. SCPEA4 TaxID=2996787 RepID=UPI00226F225C|nr:hypothetical protein [Nannocystis sp. SCPEA4]MCY1059050.1 hypothetical protein [Nannocystis sp. SCPEA4]
MNQRSVITLFIALVAGAGCSKNSEEVLTRAHKAADAQCGCVAEAMKKPWTEIRDTDCDATKAAFYDAMNPVDQSDKRGEEIFNLGRGCIHKLRDVVQANSERK